MERKERAAVNDDVFTPAEQPSSQEQPGIFRRMWSKMNKSRKGDARDTRVSEKIPDGLLNDFSAAESSGDNFDSMMFNENLPATMSFTSKRTQDDVVNWLCMDQNTTAEKILRCF